MNAPIKSTLTGGHSRSGEITHAATPRAASRGCNPAQTSLWAGIRVSAGLSLRQFEALTGINRGELSKIERGIACPTPEQAIRILSMGQVDR